jgi:hypothetical protein
VWFTLLPDGDIRPDYQERRYGMRQATAYAELVGAKAQGSTACWYRIFFDRPGDTDGSLHGPFRDRTDAENAAHDEARSRNLELEWVE